MHMFLCYDCAWQGFLRSVRGSNNCLREATTPSPGRLYVVETVLEAAKLLNPGQLGERTISCSLIIKGPERRLDLGSASWPMQAIRPPLL